MVVVPSPAADANAEAGQFTKPITTVVVDSQPLFRDALATLLGAPPLSASVISCARSDTALEILHHKSVDLVVCEVRAVPIAGIDLAEVLARELAVIPVVLLGDHQDEQYLTDALHSAVAGLFTKDSTLEEFVVGVRAVLGGHRAIGARLMNRLVTRLASEPTSNLDRTGTRLSRTELQILISVGGAESIAEIAAGRGISQKTVRNHLAKIYRKLELHGRTEAMLWAARQGLTSR